MYWGQNLNLSVVGFLTELLFTCDKKKKSTLVPNLVYFFLFWGLFCSFKLKEDQKPHGFLFHQEQRSSP